MESACLRFSTRVLQLLRSAHGTTVIPGALSGNYSAEVGVLWPITPAGGGKQEVWVATLVPDLRPKDKSAWIEFADCPPWVDLDNLPCIQHVDEWIKPTPFPTFRLHNQRKRATITSPCRKGKKDRIHGPRRRTIPLSSHKRAYPQQRSAQDFLLLNNTVLILYNYSLNSLN